MKKTKKIKNENLYGSGTGPLVSFGFGTVQQAWDDRTVGGINYGYHKDIVTGRDYGVQYMEGMLISSRVLDITFGDANADGETPVKVTFAENGQVVTREFKTVDKVLVQALVDAAKQQIEADVDEKIADISVNVDYPEYLGGDYISIVPSDSYPENYLVNVKYDELYHQIKEDLGQEGIDASQNERIAEIESTYVKYVDLCAVSEDGKRRVVETVIRTVDASTGTDVERTVEYEVPTSHFYECLDTSLGEIWDELAKKADKKDDEGWIDISTLIN